MKKKHIKYFVLPGIILLGLSLAAILLIYGSEKEADQKRTTNEEPSHAARSQASEKKPSPPQPEKQVKKTHPSPADPHEDEAVQHEETAERDPGPDMDDLKAEDEREIMRMREMLPGNMWIPGEPTQEESREHQNILRDMVILENKLRKDAATGEEKRTYYEYKIRMIDDRIAIIRYYQKRTKELEDSTGREYLSDQDMAHGNHAVTELEDERQEYAKSLSDVEDEPDEPDNKPDEPDEPDKPDEPDEPNESEDNDAYD